MSASLSPRALLTDEERRALLGPDIPSGADPIPVLLLLPRPEEERFAAAFLRRRGADVVAAPDAYAALDLFRVRPFPVFLCAADAVPSAPSWYASRVRGASPDVRIAWVCEAGAERGALPGRTVRRPLTEPVLEELWEEVGRRPGTGVRPGSTPAAAPAPGGEAGVGVSTSVRSGPDLLAGVEAILESRAKGGDLRDALNAWALRDPAVRALLEVQEDAEDWRLRVQAPPSDDRPGLARRLLENWQEVGGAAEPAAAGPFWVFPLPQPPGARFALFHEGAADAPAGLERLRALMGLVDRVAAGVPSAEPAGRDRLRSLLESRMGAARRRDGRLGLLVLRPGPGESPEQLCRVLRAALRGGDWVERVGDRVYAVLEETDRGTFDALGERLRDLPGVHRARVVALGWNPAEGDAARLLERAERILTEGGAGEALGGLSGRS